MHRKGVLLLPFVLAPLAAVAEERVRLDAIEVSAPRMERETLRTPAAIDRVDRDRVRRGREAVQLEESLNRVPGFFFQNRYNFAQNQRVSTRGFGARAPFGVRGIRVRVDGFPETLPDGQSQIDMIDLDSVRRIEVMRGPSSVLYGNATGGVIDVTTLDGRDRDARPAFRAALGRHGYRKFGLAGGDADGPWSYHVSGNALTFDGYRDQSEVRKSLVNLQVNREFDGERELATVLSAVELPRAQDPGGLTAEEVDDDRTRATAAAEDLDAGQEVSQQRLGFTWTDGSSLAGRLTARTFYTKRDFEQQLPFEFGDADGDPAAENLVAFDRDFFGVGVEYDDDVDLLGLPTRYVVGIDADRQIDRRTRDVVGTDREVFERTVDERQQATAIGVFGQADFALSPTVDLTLGLRQDRIRFRIDDALTGGDHEDFSGNRTFNQSSQTVALGWSWNEDQRVYATVGTSFETPTFTEFAREEGGGFNEDLEPSFAVNREIGARGRFTDRLDYNLALFSVRVRDEIVVRDDEQDRDFFENAAETRRDGVELGLEHFTTDALTLSASYTRSDFRFREFTDHEGESFDGNRLPGLPRDLVFIEADWRSGGRFVILDARHVGDVHADNANEVEVDSYNVVNARLGNEWEAATGEALELWIGVDNVFAEEYFDNIRINAGNGRFFEPAPERMVRVGLQATF